MTFTLPWPTGAREDNLSAFEDRWAQSMPEGAGLPEELNEGRLSASVTIHPPDKHAVPAATMLVLAYVATRAVTRVLGAESDSRIDHIIIARGLRSRNGGSLTYTVEADERTPW